ncbi:MAG: hypothetical protein ACHQ2Z_12450 [Elusimicrobiota bacterium]
MNKNNLFKKSTAALVVLTAFAARAHAQDIPNCSDWLKGDRASARCSCAGEVREGDQRLKSCESTSVSRARASEATPSANAAAPAAKIAGLMNAPGFDGGPAAPESKFGIKSVNVSGGYITGADGTGIKNGSVGVEFYRQKTKFGTLSASAEGGRYQMNGIGFTNTQSVGVVGQLPNGTPIQGTVYSQGVSPAVSYIPLANFKYEPPFKLGRIHPYAVIEGGVSRLSSTNATVNSQLVATVGGQTVGTQNLGSSLQPTGEARNHAGGGFGGGVDVDVTKHVALNTQMIDAPTGYKVFTYGVNYKIHRHQKAADGGK